MESDNTLSVVKPELHEILLDVKPKTREILLDQPAKTRKKQKASSSSTKQTAVVKKIVSTSLLESVEGVRPGILY